MTSSTTAIAGRRKTLRNVITPMLLLAALIAPLAIGAPADFVKQKEWDVAGQTQGVRALKVSAIATTDMSAQEPQKITVLRQLTQVKVSRRTQAALKSIRALRGVVSFQGGIIIKPLPGSSLWQLSTGGYALVNSTTFQGVTLPAGTPWGSCNRSGDCWVYFTTCACPGVDGDQDNCEFDGPPEQHKCKGDGCCQFMDGVIDQRGAITKLNG